MTVQTLTRPASTTASDFELDVRVVTDMSASATRGCDTSNGCAPSCASSCASEVR